jgi:hypothetical protein
MVACWCGERRPYFGPLPARCGGFGHSPCLCGGEGCVCHHHGDIECDGCEDCQPGDDDAMSDEYLLNELEEAG